MSDGRYNTLSVLNGAAIIKPGQRSTCPPPRVVAKVKVFGWTNGRTTAPNSMSPYPVLGGEFESIKSRVHKDFVLLCLFNKHIV